MPEFESNELIEKYFNEYVQSRLDKKKPCGVLVIFGFPIFMDLKGIPEQMTVDETVQQMVCIAERERSVQPMLDGINGVMK